MYARVTSVPIRPGSAAELTRLYNENVMQEIKHATGNAAAYLLIDEANNRGISITLWITEDDGEAYDASGVYRAQVAKLAQFFAGAPTLEKYEVALWG